MRELNKNHGIIILLYKSKNNIVQAMDFWLAKKERVREPKPKSFVSIIFLNHTI
jgi:hypothetical protein